MGEQHVVAVAQKQQHQQKQAQPFLPLPLPLPLSLPLPLQSQAQPQPWKSELCLFAKSGKCKFGAKQCKFAHGAEDLRPKKTTKQPLPPGVPSVAKFRTVPCWNWVTLGVCAYGSRCAFIHDPRLRHGNDATRRCAEDGPTKPSALTPREAVLFDNLCADVVERVRVPSRRLPIFQCIDWAP